MDKEYIDREKVHKLIRSLDRYTLYKDKSMYRITLDIDEVQFGVDKISASDVAEVRHGKWLLEREPDGKPYCFHCSVCDSDFHHIGIKRASDFCPNCGAKMDGKGYENEFR